MSAQAWMYFYLLAARSVVPAPYPFPDALTLPAPRVDRPFPVALKSAGAPPAAGAPSDLHLAPPVQERRSGDCPPCGFRF